MSNALVTGDESQSKPTRVRWNLMTIVFIICLIGYLDRVNLSVCATQIMEELNFDRVQLGYSMSAFFLAYAVMQIPGGIMAERWGIRKNGTLAIVWWSVFTILTPHAWGFISFIIIRMLFGLGEAPMYPNNGAFIAKWFSIKEKALPNSLMVVGTFLGPALGPPITVAIVSFLGWHWVFYSYGIIGLIFGLIWYFYSRDLPHEHPGVNEKELLHITDSTSLESATIKSEANKKIVAPWGLLLRSPRFWAFGFVYLSCNYMMYLFLSWIPLYLQEARGISFKAVGFAAMFPWMALCACTLLSGLWSDRMVRQGCSRFKARAVLGMVGLAGCGVGLYLATNAQNITQNIMFLCVSLGFLGFNFTGIWTAAQDLGKQFGGTFVSWMNFWGTVGGVIAPVVTAMLVGVIGWDAALALSACVPVLGVVSWLFVRPDQPLVESA